MFDKNVVFWISNIPEDYGSNQIRNQLSVHSEVDHKYI